MKVLIALAEQIPPQQTGGSQKVALEVAKGLQGLGDEIAVAGRLQPRERSGLGPLINAATRARLFSAERFDGVPFYRYLRESRGFPQILEAFSPDVVLVHAMAAMPLAHMVSKHEIPLVIYWHDVELHKSRGSPAGVAARFLANSSFTAAAIKAEYCIDAVVIPPLFPGEFIYPLTSGAGQNILFINPVPEKGLQRVLEIATAAPELLFEFVVSWKLHPNAERELRASLASLPNVTLTPHQSDMRPVFERARMLLAPSVWQEAWGRVASEAQASGVPVLANAIGGLQQAVGGGGILFPIEASTEDWLTAIRKLATDDGAFQAQRQRGLDYASRPEADGIYNLKRLRSEMTAAIDERRSN